MVTTGRCYIAGAIAIALFATWNRPGTAAAAKEVWPLTWGVDIAGAPSPDTSVNTEQILREFGFDLWMIHYLPRQSREDNASHIKRIDNWCQKRGLRWMANVEAANFRKTFVDERGYDWYRREDGRHFFLFPDDLLGVLGSCKQLQGICYDEAEHMQNCANMISGVNRPYIYDPAGRRLTDAPEEFTEAITEIAKLHRKHGIRLYTEQVFPVLFHNFSRAGWFAAPKILKESWSPVYIACAMGAAIQYGTPLWVSPDLWFHRDFPGHTPEEYRAALLLAYHMGVDCIYTEGLYWRGGGLVTFDGEAHTVTRLGKVAQWFYHDYVPAHPRHYSFRHVKPRVAVVRRPDACWGQKRSFLPDALFGNREWPTQPKTEAWLGLWHLLSNGTIRPDAPCYVNDAYAGQPYQVFAPLDGVIVFDDRVGWSQLKDVAVIFLTGLSVTEQTRDAVERCVSSGATCVVLPHLLPNRVRLRTGRDGTVKDGDGTWVATTDFLNPHVRPYIDHVLPRGDVIRYQFGDTTVEFRPKDGNPNRLQVNVQ